MLERVQAWNEVSAYEFARTCAKRGRGLVIEALRSGGHEEEAQEVDGLDATSFAATAPGIAARLPGEPAGLVMMAADTTALAEGPSPSEARLPEREPQLRSHLEAVAATGSTYGAIAAHVAFVIARSTAGLHSDGYESGFAAERAWQLDRLLDQLKLNGARSAPRAASHL